MGQRFYGMRQNQVGMALLLVPGHSCRVIRDERRSLKTRASPSHKFGFIGQAKSREHMRLHEITSTTSVVIVFIQMWNAVVKPGGLSNAYGGE